MKRHLFLLYFISTFSLSCSCQTTPKKLKNGKTINFTATTLFEWKEKSLFDPTSLLKGGDYNIKCYTIFPDKPNDLVQIYGYKQFSNNFMTLKDFQTQLISLYKKKANNKVDINLERTEIIDQILQKYISKFSIEDQKYLTTKVDSLFFDFKKRGVIKQNVQTFFESPSTFLFGIVIEVKVSFLNETVSISSFSGSILLKNHPYGINIILDGSINMPIEEKNAQIKNFIQSIEKITQNK